MSDESGHSERTSYDRAMDALIAVERYMHGGCGDPDDMRASIVDLTTDLLHLSHHKGFEPRDVLDMAWSHFSAERTERLGIDHA